MASELWSPLFIETVLQVYCRGDGVLCGPTQDSPAHADVRWRIEQLGLAVRRDEGEGDALFPTELCKGFVSLICQTPIPLVRYVDPRMEKTP